MAGRRLDPEERALWHKVTESVRPIADRTAHRPPPPREEPVAPPKAHPSRPSAPRPTVKPTAVAPADTLDGGWDRRLRRGSVIPERTIDLHGHTLLSAHAALEQAIDRALADEVRVLLVITGRAPRDSEATPRRGAIRAAIGDWIGGSRHSPRIAAVRNAHPRHGGAGALYLILRRARERP